MALTLPRGATKIMDFTVDGLSIEIGIAPSTGIFMAILDGEKLEAPSLNAMKDRLKKKVRTTRKIAVPITLADDYQATDPEISVRHVVLTGLVSGARHVLAKDEATGKSDRLTYMFGTALRRLTPLEEKELRKLHKAAVAANDAVEEWIAPRTVNPNKLVEEAMQVADPALDRNTEREG